MSCPVFLGYHREGLISGGGGAYCRREKDSRTYCKLAIICSDQFSLNLCSVHPSLMPTYHTRAPGISFTKQTPHLCCPENLKLDFKAPHVFVLSRIMR